MNLLPATRRVVAALFAEKAGVRPVAVITPLGRIVVEKSVVRAAVHIADGTDPRNEFGFVAHRTRREFWCFAHR
jgi:hypothetical protein